MTHWTKARNSSDWEKKKNRLRQLSFVSSAITIQRKITGWETSEQLLLCAAATARGVQAITWSKSVQSNSSIQLLSFKKVLLKVHVSYTKPWTITSVWMHLNSPTVNLSVHLWIECMSHIFAWVPADSGHRLFVIPHFYSDPTALRGSGHFKPSPSPFL